MGRELRRVPLDFDWPRNKVWKGFINTEYRPCPGENVTCFRGYTAANQWLDSLCRLIAMVGQEAAEADRPQSPDRIYPHPFLQEWQQAPRHDIPRSVKERCDKESDSKVRMGKLFRYLQENPPQILPLTAEIRTFVENLAGEALDERYPGSHVTYNIEKKLKTLANLPENWGICPVCKGEGVDPAAQAAYEAWTKTNPPKGDGYQLWETVSEGSPCSPVFATPEELARWLVENDTSITKDTTYEQWLKFINGPGWAPSGMIMNGQMMSGVKAMTQDTDKDKDSDG